MPDPHGDGCPDQGPGQPNVDIVILPRVGGRPVGDPCQVENAIHLLKQGGPVGPRGIRDNHPLDAGPGRVLLPAYRAHLPARRGEARHARTPDEAAGPRDQNAHVQNFRYLRQALRE